MRTPSETAAEIQLQDLALARAVVARCLKLALRAPDPSTYRDLFSSEAREALEGAASVLGFEAPVPGAVSLSGMTASHVRLFGHSLRGRVCPYEVEYGKKEPISQAHELSDVSGFYRAFGLEPSPSTTERWDHVAVELEFLELLSMKEAYAIETGQPEMYELTRHALKRFVREHLGHFGIALGASLENEDPDGFHGLAGRLLGSYLTAVCRELEVPAGPRTLPLSPIEEDRTPMACGASEPVASPAFEV
jgi:TorA maturation chaperone TorD